MLEIEFFRYLPFEPAVALVLGLIGAPVAVYATIVRNPAGRRAAKVMLGSSVLVILVITARGRFSNPDAAFSWHLGESIRGEFNNINQTLGLVNNFGNIALFMPIGWFVAVLWTRRPILIGTLFAVAFSLLVEVLQSLSGTGGDVDDLVLNGLGGFLGASIVTLILRLLPDC